MSDKLRLAAGSNDKNSKKHNRQLKWLSRWQRPTFPLKGRDLLEKGLPSGPQISKALTELEKHWVESNFELSGDDLLALIEPPSGA